MPANDEQVFVLDRDSMFRLWLADKVSSGKLSQAQADQLWRRSRDDARFFANYFSTGQDLALLTKLARDLQSPIARCYFKTYNGKQHIIFKGHPGVRRILTGTRYGVQNAKVVSMGLGRAGVVKSARGGTIVSVFLLTAWNITDFVLRDDATLGQLLGGIAADISKAAIGGAIGGMVGATAVGTAVGAFALGPLFVAVVVSVGVGLALDWIDERYKLTKRLQKMLDEAFVRFDRAVEEQRNNALDSGRDALGALAGRLIDLAADAAIDFARRELQRLTWRFMPRF
jgi:hypothetical protein